MIWAALATVVAAPALAQDAPAEAKTKAPATTATSTRPSGAVSSSYARCTPGSPIGGIVVKGGTNPTKRTGDAETECPATGAGEAAEGKGRTYTGGRRNEDAPSAVGEAIAPVTRDQMPSRLSMTPTTAKTVTPAEPADKSISEKGLPASKPSKPH